MTLTHEQLQELLQKIERLRSEIDEIWGIIRLALERSQQRTE